MILLAVTGFCFAPGEAKAADSWDNSVTSELFFKIDPFNASAGVFHVYVRYHDAIDNNATDGWLQNVYLRYSTDGTNYNDIYYFDDETYLEQPSDISAWVSNARYYVVDKSSSYHEKWVDITIAVNDITKAIKNIKLEGRTVPGNDKKPGWERNNTSGDAQEVNTSRTITIPFTNINTPTYEFINIGVSQPQVRLKYTISSLNDIDKNSNSTIQLYSGTGAVQNTTKPVSSEGFAYVPISNQEVNYSFKEKTPYTSPVSSITSGWSITASSLPVTVKAFVLPASASAGYDVVNHTVNFAWAITPVNAASQSSGNYEKYDFVYEIANNSSFSNPIKGTASYNPKDPSFSVPYPSDQNLSPHLYFRVSRDIPGNSNWKWQDVAKTTDIIIPFVSLNTDSTKASPVNNAAKVTWNPRPDAWLPNSTFVLTKFNYTANTQATITLDEETFKKGIYTDKQIATCTEYHYQLQITPPSGAGFTAKPPVDVRDSVIRTDIGTLVKGSMVATKGYFPDRTELTWSSDGSFDNFIIKRAEYGSSNYIQIASVPATSTGTYNIDDTKGTPGTYYTYQVSGIIDCNNQLTFSKEALTAVGFRSPTGNIYGRVQYSNGQAVNGVSVRLESKAASQLGKSVYLNGSSYLGVDSLVTPFTDTATIEAWIKPDDNLPKNSVILSRDGQYELGFNDTSGLYFTANGVTVAGAYSNPNKTFIHVAAVRSKNELKLMLDTTVIGIITSPVGVSKAAKSVLIGKKNSGNYFKGFIDEMRVWNKPLSDSLLKRDYTRLMSGDEDSLTAYWRMDEVITDQFYDISHTGTKYHRNDGFIATGAVHTDTIPTAGQLSLKAYTDVTGNYFISGVPYTGNGTTYSITPTLGTHQFDPATVNRLISASSTEFTVDFTDKSSFLVSGEVKYKNSNVPVAGVQFKIDGQYAQGSNGDILQTKADGTFEISVPVGRHEVKAVLTNHVFEGDGRIVERDGVTDLNYQAPVIGITLMDSTTIRFIGRVAGGTIQAAYPLGHSLSKNNLGDSLKVIIKTKNESYYFNARKDTVLHELPADQTDSSEIHKTVVEFSRDGIVIRPDPVTGEFAVNLIPEKFDLTGATVTGWGNLLPVKQELDFTNKFFVQQSAYNHKDSVYKDPAKPELGYLVTDHKDTINYNASYNLSYRVKEPIVSITQVDGSNKALSYFGDLTYKASSFTGQNTNLTITDPAKPGMDKYLFGLPMFKQDVLYNFAIKAYESYPYYVINGATYDTLRGSDNKPVVDNVPTQDGKVSINNQLREEPQSPEQVALDSATGTAAYSFTAGEPNLTTGGKADFFASVQFGAATFVNWKWEGSIGLHGYILGGKSTGTDFVTQGPDQILMVLRDPPGSRSYSYADTGTTVTHSTTYTGTADQSGDEEFVRELGAYIVTFKGIGAGTIDASITEQGSGFNFHHEEHFTGEDTKVSSTTFTNRWQTSDDPAFVGTRGDVYVGYSTNVTYGNRNSVVVINKADLSKSDELITDTTGYTGDYLMVIRSVLNMGEKFGTMFSYPQQFLEKTLVPNLHTLRDKTLRPIGSDTAQAQRDANTTGAAVYVSKLANDDPNFGKSNRDTKTFGEDVLKDIFGDGPSYYIFFPKDMVYRNDDILALNQSMDGWVQTMADNEKEKLNSKLFKNYSFASGSPVEVSKQTNKDTTKSRSFQIVVASSLITDANVKIFGSGFTVDINESIGTTQGGTFDSTNSGSKTLGFVLASDGTDEYFSVDVNTVSGDGSFAFRTKGGASVCPYEGPNKTQYYQPGTDLDQPTLRIEVPVLTIDNPVASNVPSVRPAVYTLVLRNESEAKLPANFVLGYADVAAVSGANIAVDGVSIGGEGRSIVVPYGDSVVKVLTLTKGPDSLNYKDIPIVLHSSCQYDPTGYLATIADTIFISAHFVPSCTDIHLAEPAPQWTLNTKSPVENNKADKPYLPVIIDGFDAKYALFNHVELQVKEATSSAWTKVMKFYPDSARYREGSGEAKQVFSGSAISYNFVLDNVNYRDQNYDIRAVSSCLTPPNEIVTPTELASGIKDVYNPRQFGSTEPGDGILGLGDDIRINFNEPIEGGLLTNSSFSVTGIRNGTKGNHSVSVNLDGQNDYLATEFEKNLTAKSITVEVWARPASPSASGTFFSQGKKDNSLELALTADHHLEAIIGKAKFKSSGTVNPDGWCHVALVYDNAGNTITVYYADDKVSIEPISAVPVPDKYTGTGHFEFGRSISQGGNLFAGNLHEARVWTMVRSADDIAANRLTGYSGNEPNLMAYYPMDEGKGRVAYDKAYSSNATLAGNWTTPPGKSVHFNGTGYVRTNTSAAPVLSAMDYTVELWFKGELGQTNATLAANGKGDGTDGDGAKNLFFLGFENGLLTYRNDGFKVQADSNYLDNNWHHVAVAVNRVSGTGQLYVDGNMKKTFDAANVGGIQSQYAYLGARAWYSDGSVITPNYDRYFRGFVDEFRIWNTYLNQTFIENNNNTKLNGDEFGLLTYYPFEKNYTSAQGIQSVDTTLFDMAHATANAVSYHADTAGNVTMPDDKAPIKDRGPVSKLKYNYVANNDAIIITLNEPDPEAIDKRVVTIGVLDVKDINRNPLLSPITWTAYIDQHQLKWGDKELTLIKDINAPMQFETYIVNKGGTLQHFHLSTLPVWLSADATSGSIDPAGKQKIVFTINQSLNIGTYNEVVYMYNDNNETEALAINVTVRGRQPEWTINPGDYKYNMSVYGKLRINGEFSDNDGDLLAAFINGKCVGVTHNTHFAANDLWYAFLTVYSDTIKYSNLEFRIWEANTGKTYLAVPSAPVLFTNDAVIGTASNPVIFDGKEIIYQNIDITHGWNWISFGVTNPNLTNVTTTLANGSWKSGDIIKNNELGFDQYSAGSGWVGYMPGFNNISLFMLNAANPQTLSLAGSAVDVKNTAIPLKGGRWNYISYLPQVNMTLKDALAGYDATDEDVIKSQTGFAMYDSQNGWIGNLSYLEPGKGYMLYRKRTPDTAFHYPVSALDGFRQGNGSILNALETPVTSNYNYAENMTVTAIVGNEYAVQAGDVLLAYAGNEVRGQAQMITNAVINTGTLFFNIAGDNEQPVSFALQRNGKTIASSDAVFNYKTDEKVGTVSTPFVIHLKSSKELITAYPNPFSHNINIAVDLPAEQSSGTHEVQVSIHNSVGQLVLSRAKEIIYNGHYQMAWNGRKANGSDCAPGVYLINANIDGTVHVYKVIKQ